MTRSPQGDAFLKAREQFVREFALTRYGKKRMLDLLAKYDDLLYHAYHPHVIGQTLRAARAKLTELEAAAPALPPGDPLLVMNVGERTGVLAVILELEKLLKPEKPEPEKPADAAPADVPAGA